MKCLAAAALAGLSVFAATSAQAGAWIPAAGSGYVESMLRFSTADRSFPAGSFSTATSPSSQEHTTQLRVTGEHGVGQGFSFDYDLRYALESRSKTKKGVTTTTESAGLEDQRVGVNYGLFQSKSLAETAGLGVVFPGTAIDATSTLSSGEWAFEPIYRLGFKPGILDLTLNVDVAPRIFLDGGVTQFRTHFEVGAPVFHRVRLIGKLFFVRSVKMSGYNDVRDRCELYDLLRFGIGVQFHLTNSIEPVVAYESDIAGMSQHASRRVTVGVKIKY